MSTPLGLNTALILGLLLPLAAASAKPAGVRCAARHLVIADLAVAHETNRRAHLEGDETLMEKGLAD